MYQIVKIKMLGDFFISVGEAKTGGDNRSRKVQLLMAYLTYCRGRDISQEELIHILWGSEKEIAGGALKTTLWRARKLLKPLEDAVGGKLILRVPNGYRWNPAFPAEVDLEEFEALCLRGKECEDEDARLDLYRAALERYEGAFLGELSSEFWAAPIAAHYLNVYIEVLLETLPLLQERHNFREAESLCRTAIQQAPYQEELHQHLMRSLMGQQEFEKAAAVYTSLRERLFSDLGVLPENGTQELASEISRNISGYALSPDLIQGQLREKGNSSEAVVCDYALFRHFYQAEERSMARRGDAIHIGILSLTDKEGLELPKRSLDRAMENLGVQIRKSLRRSDIAARCSPSQYVILLLQANYENSRMVCERTVRSFMRAYPHSPASIQYTVRPLASSETKGE